MSRQFNFFTHLNCNSLLEIRGANEGGSRVPTTPHTSLPGLFLPQLSETSLRSPCATYMYWNTADFGILLAYGLAKRT